MFTLREVHSLAFDRVGDDHRWLIGISRRLRAFQGRDNLQEVVTVDLEATPAKLLKYAPQIDSRPWITAVATMLFIDCKHPTELLQAIPVQNGGKISQLVSGSDMQRFPNHSLLQFAVADHHKGLKLLPSQPGA